MYIVVVVVVVVVYLLRFCGGRLPLRTALEQLFSNYSWALANTERDKTDELEEILNIWHHPNVFLTLVLFIVTRLLFTAISIGLPVPAGVFLPVFVVGAAFGRLVGEGMGLAFPAGFNNNTIVPGAYAVIGAAAVTGAVTHTISTSVIVFELTGQITHVLPVLIAVLLANAVAQRLQPSFYDSIILLKKLPYLPELPLDLAGTTIVKHFMRTNVPTITTRSSYKDLKYLISSTNLPSYPVIDNQTSRFLIGSVKRSLLEGIYNQHFDKFKEVYNPSLNRGTSSEEITMLPLEETAVSTDSLQEQELYNIDEIDNMVIEIDESKVDAAPFQLVEKTSLIKVHTLFALLTLNHSYVTDGGRLVGIVTLKEIRTAIEDSSKHRVKRSPSGTRFKNMIAVFRKKGQSLGDETIIIEENSD